MTIERAKRLAEQWESGGVCTLREGEAQEYHRLFLSMLLGKQDVVRCRECKHYKQDACFRKKCFNDLWNQEFAVPTEPDDFCSYGERIDGDG